MAKPYRVVWEIDIDDAKTPLEAAREALEIQRDPTSAATVFQVFEGDKLIKEIDLETFLDGFAIPHSQNGPSRTCKQEGLKFHVVAQGDATVGDGSHYAMIDVPEAVTDNEYRESVRAILKEAFDKIFDSKARVLTDEEFQNQ